MRKVFLLLLLFIVSLVSFSQTFSVDEILQLPTLSPRKMETYISKKGFIVSNKTWQNDTIVDSWQEKPVVQDSGSDYQVPRRLSKYQNGDDVSFCFQTADKNEYSNVVTHLQNEGFSRGNLSNAADTQLLFQKMNVTVQAFPMLEDTITFYNLVFQQKPIPSSKNIRFAEDLLQFTSHEFLAGYFGKENVKKDIYYFSDNKINKCSILFPNSSRQVVFIWKDENNLTGLSNVVIGGSVPTAGNAEYEQQVPENNWTLSNGLRSNMKLEELIRQNGSDVNFYGTSSEYYLKIVPEKTGYFDFTDVSVVLDCVNCSGSLLMDKQTISGTDAYEQNLSLHVGMIMLSPLSTKPTHRYVSR